MGKTSLALNIAQHVGDEGEGMTVGVFSLEMSREQLFLRMLSSEAQIDGHAPAHRATSAPTTGAG